MTTAQESRLRAYLDAVKPHVLALREQGWPVEASVSVETGSPVVSLTLDVDDGRVPVEARPQEGATA